MLILRSLVFTTFLFITAMLGGITAASVPPQAQAAVARPGW